MSLKITDEEKHKSIDISDLVNGREIFINAYGGGNSVQLTLTEIQIRALRKHLTIQIRKLKSKEVK